MIASAMAAGSPLSLAYLRDIGWREWDPIGLINEGESWQDHPAVDEYDQYLLHAVSLLRRGETEAHVAAYLARIESNHMALGTSARTGERAFRTAQAIQAYLDTL